MLWLIPFLLVCLFLLFRFVSPYEPIASASGRFRSSEPFESPPPPSPPLLVSDSFRTSYAGFLAFYLPFQERWRDALVRAWGLEQPPSALNAEKRKEPTDKDLAEMVAKRIHTVGKPFPSPKGSSPKGSSPKGSSSNGQVLPPPSSLQTLEDVDRARLMEYLPSSSEPYLNALEWMNEQMLRAEKELEKALQGGGLPALEGFAGEETCAELSQCFRDNPELVRQLLLAQQEEAGNRLERTEKELMSRMAQFQQPKLVSAFELNGRLAKRAKETEAKAQSGDWIKDVRIKDKGEEREPPIVLPPGGDALEALRRNDPERYKTLQQGNPSLFSLKQLMEQINRGLR